MKLTVGLGSIDDYEEYAIAGADEFFAGFVPDVWMERFGTEAALNRREVLYVNVQIGSFSELLILKDMVGSINVPVAITLNAVHYTQEQIDLIPKIVLECLAAGIRDYIVADERMIFQLSEKFGKRINIHLSGEYGELNSLILGRFKSTSVIRIIFPRQTSISEMKSMIKAHPEYEYEAFLLNEKCHFTGAYCNSLHCDELCHACKIPYQLADLNGENTGSGITELDPNEDIEEYVTGSSGCGLCNLWSFKEIGITHLKLVSRGNDTESTIKDIKTIKKALQILSESSSESEYRSAMLAEIFPDGCSHNCYHNSPV